MTDPLIDIFIPGIPVPGGSKKAFKHPKTGAIIVMDDAKGNAGWKAVVWGEAKKQYRGEPLAGPLEVDFAFTLPRPKDHYGTGRNAGKVKLDAPEFHITRPDITKFIRASEDAAKGVLWGDDGQIVRQTASKEYGETPGVRIRVWRAT